VKFDIYGPYEVPRHQHGRARIITRNSLRGLAELIDNEDMINGCGCYVFAMRAGRGYTPWYVGQASKMRLLEESMNANNRENYNRILLEQNGTPVIFYIPKLTNGNRFAKPTRNVNGQLKSVNFLEEWLIATALQKNPKLINHQKTHFLKNLHVVGLINPRTGENNNTSAELKRAIF
jgi:hypothetical protein